MNIYQPIFRKEFWWLRNGSVPSLLGKIFAIGILLNNFFLCRTILKEVCDMSILLNHFSFLLNPLRKVFALNTPLNHSFLSGTLVKFCIFTEKTPKDSTELIKPFYRSVLVSRTSYGLALLRRTYHGSPSLDKTFQSSEQSC